MESVHDLLVLAKLKMKLDEAIVDKGLNLWKTQVNLDMYFIALNTENRHCQHGTVYCTTSSTFVVQYHAGGGAKKMKEEWEESSHH